MTPPVTWRVAAISLLSGLSRQMVAAVQAAPSYRILLEPSPLPCGYPPLDQIQREWFTPAFNAGIETAKRNVDRIVSDPEEATFDNTIAALEKSSLELNRSRKVFSSLILSDTDDHLKKIQRDFSPKFTEMTDYIYMNDGLFKRVSSIIPEGLDLESQRLLQEYRKIFHRRGSLLSKDDKQKMMFINKEISRLQTEFKQAADNGMNAGAVLITNINELEGLGQDQIDAAAEAAKKLGHNNAWLLALSNTTIQPWLQSLKTRSVREKIYRASISRGLEGSPFPTFNLIKQLAKLRAERAQLLSYKHHADYVISNKVALDFTKVSELLESLADCALKKARLEASDIQKEMETDGTDLRLSPWDWEFYAEKIRQKKFSFSDSEVRPYFEMNRVLHDGVFYAANRLYGITAKLNNRLPVYHPDVKVYELFNEDGTQLGIILLDYFARSSKTGGGWMSSYVIQSELLNQAHAVVLNNLNIPKPVEGNPTLMTFDEVTTAFHEFGHALHGLFSRVKYPKFSGTNVPTDFVEFPSQLNEIWTYNREVVSNFARHYQTDEPIPETLLDNILAAKKFNQGFKTLEYALAAILDQAWHQITPDTDIGEVADFERNAFAKFDINGAIGPRYRSCYFQHIFGSGYASGYYSYIYAEIMVRCIEKWIAENGGLCRDVGDKLRSKLLSKGFSEDPYRLFVEFYGKDLSTQPLFEYLEF